MPFSQHQIQELPILALAFFMSMLLALALTPVADHLAWKIGLIDQPSRRKVHVQFMTRAGGLAMALATLLTILILFKWNDGFTAFWSGAGILLLIGALDDKLRLRSRWKFAAQILAVGLFMHLSGYRVEDLGNVFGFGPLEMGVLAPWLTLVAMVGLINAFNLADGLDGLAAGKAGIVCLFFLPFALALESWVYLIILISLFGALLGFLRYNVYPAKLFMGDTGSLFLGYSLAAAAVALIQGEMIGERNYQPTTVLIILSLPVWDTLYVMARRLLHGQNPFRADKRHLHHRLMNLGFSHEVSVSLIYVFMFFMGLCAWIVRPWPAWIQFYSLLGFYTFLYLGLWWVENRDAAQVPKKKLPPVLKTTRGAVYKATVFARKHRTRLFILIWSVFLLPAVVTRGTTESVEPYYILFIFLVISMYFPWRDNKSYMPIAHGVMFCGIYSLVLVYSINFEENTWFQIYMGSLAGISAVWTVLRVRGTYRLRTLFPCGFELLLMGAAVVAPILLHYSIGIAPRFRMLLILSFLYSIPLLMMLKAYLRRAPSSNHKFMGYLMLVYLVLAGSAVF